MALEQWNAQSLDYAIALQKIIYAICNGRELDPALEKLAPHNYAMAAEYLASVSGSRPKGEDAQAAEGGARQNGGEAATPNRRS